MKAEQIAEQSCTCSTRNSDRNETAQTRANAGFPAEQQAEQGAVFPRNVPPHSYGVERWNSGGTNQPQEATR